ncbi:MAG: hypothetical protein E7616_07000 [Ruminococcaceae bacterium]|nr:hypothetical protein [Oscillospiraceae bacterium]
MKKRLIGLTVWMLLWLFLVSCGGEIVQSGGGTGSGMQQDACRHEQLKIGQTLEATCTREGTVGGLYCADCGAELVKPLISPMTEHTIVDGDCTVCHFRSNEAELEYMQSPRGYIVVGIGSFTGSHLTIPATYKDMPVYKIADYAFEDQTGLQTVNIGSEVTEIGCFAFTGCTSLTKVTIPAGVSKIGEKAFDGCTAPKICCDRTGPTEFWHENWLGDSGAVVKFTMYTPIPNHELPTLALFENDVTLIVGMKDWCFYERAFCANYDTISITSADESIAVVDENGVVTGVSEGSTTVDIVLKRDRYQTVGTVNVRVLDPSAINDPIDIELITIMKNEQQFTGYNPFLVNVGALDGKYNYDEISDATPGPVEIWADTLQFIFILNQNEVDASEGIDVPETYDWYFDLYYKPYDAMDEELGGYKKVPLQAWSCYRFGDYDGGILYRCKFYDTGLGSLEEGEYEAKLVVRQGDEIKGWYDMGALSWTDSCLSFIHYAENNSDIFK